MKNHLKGKHLAEYHLMFEMSSETSQSSLMDFTVPAVKKLPSSSSLATKLTNGVAEFITRDLRPVSVVSIVATSVPSERLFSVAGNVVNAKRSSL